MSHIKTAEGRKEWHRSWLQNNVLVGNREPWCSCGCSLTQKSLQQVVSSQLPHGNSTPMVWHVPQIPVLEASDVCLLSSGMEADGTLLGLLIKAKQYFEKAPESRLLPEILTW